MTAPRLDDLALAVIGGTGVYSLKTLSETRELIIDTPYGAPSAPIRVGLLAGKRVAFLARHGEGHHLPPHRINYRRSEEHTSELQSQMSKSYAVFWFTKQIKDLI